VSADSTSKSTVRAIDFAELLEQISDDELSICVVRGSALPRTRKVKNEDGNEVGESTVIRPQSACGDCPHGESVNSRSPLELVGLNRMI